MLLNASGIDNNPAYYQAVLESPWLGGVSARQVLLDWGVQRCGRADVPEVLEAYSLLFDTIYQPGTPYLWCCNNPVFCSTALPGDDIARPAYNTTLLYKAWSLMADAAPKCNSEAFNYDLVDIGKKIHRHHRRRVCAERLLATSRSGVSQHGTVRVGLRLCLSRLCLSTFDCSNEPLTGSIRRY
jgi:hypothetical protein